MLHEPGSMLHRSSTVPPAFLGQVIFTTSCQPWRERSAAKEARFDPDDCERHGRTCYNKASKDAGHSPPAMKRGSSSQKYGTKQASSCQSRNAHSSRNPFTEGTVREILPYPLHSSFSGKGAVPAREWVMPAFIARRDYARTCKMLPPGMPDCLDVSVVHTEEGIERCTAVIYGAYAYLIHYEFKPTGRADE
jgi:hypothetical protein